LDALAIERQAHGHACALADSAANLHLAAVQPHQTLDDRQSKAGSAVPTVKGGACLEVRLADAREIFIADANAGVFDDEGHVPGFRASTKRDFAAAIGEANGVGKEVQQDLIERTPVGDYLRKLAGRHSLERDAGVVGSQG
jgi:hypothetical protein